MIPICLAAEGAWLLPDVCSAPACVEKAYAEARPLAEQIDESMRMEEAA